MENVLREIQNLLLKYKVGKLFGFKDHMQCWFNGAGQFSYNLGNMHTTFLPSNFDKGNFWGS